MLLEVIPTLTDHQMQQVRELSSDHIDWLTVHEKVLGLYDEGYFRQFHGKGMGNTFLVCQKQMGTDYFERLRL